MATYVDIPAVSTGGTVAASGSGQAVQEAALSALLGVSNLNSLCFMPMGGGNTSSWSASGTGTGPATQDTVNDTDPTYAADSAGGYFVMGTGTGASAALGQNNAFIQTPNFAGRATFLKYNDPARKFGMAWVGKIISTPDANTVLQIGSAGSVTAALGNIRMGVIGSISTTKFTLAIGANAGATITSTVSIDTGLHTVLMWMDGTNFNFKVDTETVQTVSAIAQYPLNGGTGNSNPLLLADKVSGSVNHLFGTKLALWMGSVS